MALKNKLIESKVMHARKLVKENRFVYKAPYILISENNIPKSNIVFGVNKPAFTMLSFKQFGDRSGKSPFVWVKKYLEKHKIESNHIYLMTQPKQYGYVFNPVSFYFCMKDNLLVAVLAEVNNTFGQTHSYLIYDKTEGGVNKNKWYRAEKFFHVSPFLEVKGNYQFRFSFEKNKVGVWINYYKNDKLALLTSIIGHYKPLTTWQIFKTYTLNPFYAFKVIFLIHWQALILWKKKVGYYKKPNLPVRKVTNNDKT